MVPDPAQLESDLEVTQTALKAIQSDLQRDPTTEQKIAALQAQIDALQATLPAPAPDECHPDVWDSTGRLISHDRLNAV